ncbi:hypothetical protein BJF78_23050 [Pseudonocardia sp. CNS-139]|nr:hypothetical protein BJF78_23050 [Pseudonocardia sp. CNS-139]
MTDDPAEIGRLVRLRVGDLTGTLRRVFPVDALPRLRVVLDETGAVAAAAGVPEPDDHTEAAVRVRGGRVVARADGRGAGFAAARSVARSPQRDQQVLVELEPHRVVRRRAVGEVLGGPAVARVSACVSRVRYRRNRGSTAARFVQTVPARASNSTNSSSTRASYAASVWVFATGTPPTFRVCHAVHRSSSSGLSTRKCSNAAVTAARTPGATSCTATHRSSAALPASVGPHPPNSPGTRVTSPITARSISSDSTSSAGIPAASATTSSPANPVQRRVWSTCDTRSG